LLIEPTGVPDFAAFDPAGLQVAAIVHVARGV
jgi:hypothetical protein